MTFTTIPFRFYPQNITIYWFLFEQFVLDTIRNDLENNIEISWACAIAEYKNIAKSMVGEHTLAYCIIFLNKLDEFPLI